MQNYDVKRLFSMLGECMITDKIRIRKQLRRIKSTPENRNNAQYERAEQAVLKSIQKKQNRESSLPKIEFPMDLPICQSLESIAETIKNNQVSIIAGETGSGKTTQLPKICLTIGRGVFGMIGHTQPRRIAARSVANRIADELNSELGGVVGYKVRFSDRVSDKSYIKMMTDGILLAETQSDRYLNGYDTIIIDEAHERSLNIDFLLGYLKYLLPKRPDLKLIITSATIDTERFSKHFNNAPVIEVSGRTYPVEVRYRPLVSADENEKDKDMQEAILAAVDELSTLDRHGDVLVFLSGERDIRDTAEALRKHHPPNTQILPLYSRQSASEQNKIFQQSSHRRIILATNVAETSLTVPGIRYVVDPGLARISRYSYRNKVQRLPIEKISQSSANQRKGRCGRVANGVCIRLFSEEEFLAKAEFTDPQIKRTNLASVILQMESLSLGDFTQFPFIDAPDQRYVNDGYKLLFELGAIDSNKRLTTIGKQLAKLPVDPKIGRMLIAAKQFNCLHELLIITSVLSSQDPRERPADAQQKADEAHKKYFDEQSDFLFYLNLWDAFEEKRKHLSNNKLRKFCQQNFLSYMRMKEWREVYKQLHTLVTEMGWRTNQTPGEYSEVHKSLCSGLLSSVGFKSDKFEYQGQRNIRFYIHPSSALIKKNPKWIIAGELVETAKLYARLVAKIEPRWIEEMAQQIVKRSYSDPHWEKKAGHVVAYECVTLYGLVINPRRRVNYGPIDSKASHEIFIRSALVQRDFRTNFSFYSRNLELVAEIEELEAKSRRRDILVDDNNIIQFYQERIPGYVYDRVSFEKWYKSIGGDSNKLLLLNKEDLMQQDTQADQAQFPDTMCVDGVELELKYHFEPGHEDDGVTLQLPIALLKQAPENQFERLVPGLLRDKIIALIKSLPKSIRKSFVPAPNYADACLQALNGNNSALIPEISNHLQKMTGVEIPADAWNLQNLPQCYFMNFIIVGAHNDVLAKGRRLSELKANLANQASNSFASFDRSQYERDGITVWDFGEIPEELEIQHDGLTIKAYPTLVDNGNDVSYKLFEDSKEARDSLCEGIKRLFINKHSQQIRYLEKNVPNIDKLCLQYATVDNCTRLKQDFVSATIERALFKGESLIRSEIEFEQSSDRAKTQLLEIGNKLSGVLSDVLLRYSDINKSIKGNIAFNQIQAFNDIKEQISYLVYPGFLLSTPWQWLLHFPRYFNGIQVRLEKLHQSVENDRQRQTQIQGYWDKFKQYYELNPGVLEDSLWREFRWMLEEMRISLFAQQLKTAMPVSTKRIEEKWKQLQK